MEHSQYTSLNSKNLALQDSFLAPESHKGYCNANRKRDRNVVDQSRVHFQHIEEESLFQDCLENIRKERNLL